jgi:hypothetical protein
MKNTRLSNYIKILPVVAELFVTDGLTDEQVAGHDEVNSRFS